MEEVRRLKAGIFQALGHPTRLAILELLHHGELPVGTILARLGIEQANASQHLSTLRARRLVSNRKEGNQVFYSVRDPLLLEVLEIMRRYSMAHLQEDLALLRELEGEDAHRAGAPRRLVGARSRKGRRTPAGPHRA
jgi:ArsR family transcriptional regulator